MVESQGTSVPEVEKKFLTFLINYIVESNPDMMSTNLTHLTKHMTDNMDSNSEENKHRKQFGNLK